MTTNTILDRQLGQLPLSIGTSLAIEALLGIHPDSPIRKSDLNRLKGMWLNLPTLIRNLHQAMTSADFEKAAVDSAAFIVLEEIKIISQLLKAKYGNEYVVHCCTDNSEELKWRYPNASWIVPKTAKQLYRRKWEDETLRGLLMLLDHEGITWTAVNKNPPTTPMVIALLTHLPHQLMWWPWFGDLYLLESHTGKLKAMGQWYTKLKTVRVEDRIPFTKFTLLFFGDGNLFAPQDLELRRELVELAETKRWTHISSDERLTADISQYGSRSLQECHNHLLARGVAR